MLTERGRQIKLNEIDKEFSNAEEQKSEQTTEILFRI